LNLNRFSSIEDARTIGAAEEESSLDLSLGATAFWWGIFTAISLPLGAFLGMWLNPRKKINSAFMAFGAGALLFALTIELFGHVPHHVEEHGFGALIVALSGAIAGGVLFDLLNNLLNNRGAFLRKLSSARNYVAWLKRKDTEKLIEEVSGVKILTGLRPEQMAGLVQRIKKKTFSRGEVIFRQGDHAEEMFFIVKGKVDIIHRENSEVTRLALLDVYDTFGELGILSGYPRSADAIAKTDICVYCILQSDFDHFLRENPELESDIKSLAASRLRNSSLRSGMEFDEEWRDETFAKLDDLGLSVSNEEILAEGRERSKGHAAMAIWLGILIDGIPESLVIGMLAVSSGGISMGFIAGVFLANMPEAMSSAVSMRANKMSLKRIYVMWGSICLMTGIGAFLGAIMFPENPTGELFYVMVGIESLAAGAMLTMIAETMLPEAFEQGGAIVGLSTLVGFLAALIAKVL
jgi:CRP-like cAMP-binding protein